MERNSPLILILRDSYPMINMYHRETYYSISKEVLISGKPKAKLLQSLPPIRHCWVRELRWDFLEGSTSIVIMTGGDPGEDRFLRLLNCVNVSSTFLQAVIMSQTPWPLILLSMASQCLLNLA